MNQPLNIEADKPQERHASVNAEVIKDKLIFTLLRGGVIQVAQAEELRAVPIEEFNDAQVTAAEYFKNFFESQGIILSKDEFPTLVNQVIESLNRSANSTSQAAA